MEINLVLMITNKMYHYSFFYAGHLYFSLMSIIIYEVNILNLDFQTSLETR
jgi:hypothetical protein